MPTVVELFAGAGLLSHAFRRQGFRLLRAVEIDRAAASTYAANVGPHIEVSDVRGAKPAGRCDVLLAGPPCQGFSTLGKRDANDPRNFLTLEIVRWAKAMRPTVVVVENVAAFLSSELWQAMAEGLGGLGYTIGACVLNAVDFGVPQRRVRSFTFASRRDVPKVNVPKHPRIMTVREAWEGLSKVPDGRNHHVAPNPSSLALARMKAIPLGGDKRDVMRKAPHLAPPSWWRLNCEVVDVWGRMQWDCPANTLRTCLQNPSKGRYIHPDQHRVISLREAARLHTIPDDWEFVGLPTQVARQIGNSVPPRLGQAVARAVARSLAA